MKSTATVLAIAAASLAFSAVSSAQVNVRRGMREELPQAQQPYARHDQQRDYQRDQRRDRRHEEGRDGQRSSRQDDQRFYQADTRRNDRYGYYNARGPEFRRGAYMPGEFRSRQYIVNDYGAHRLHRPPYGQQWVQVGPDYLLVAIATGLIANIVLSQ